MTDLGNASISSGSSLSQELALGDLLEQLSSAQNTPLRFAYGGHVIGAGYHITEVKSARIAAIDCGSNPEEWTELFIQLLDIEGDGPAMQATKFAAILSAVTERLQFDMMARLTFEVSDGLGAMQLYGAATPVLRDGVITVPLIDRPASCKPMDLERVRAASESSSCCSRPSTTAACCG